MMTAHLWISGVLMAFAVFGIKAGIGLAPRAYDGSVPRPVRALFLGGCILAYLALFTGIYLLVTRLNLLNYLDRITKMMAYGMAVHLVVASGLLAWGAKLLLTPSAQESAKKAGLLLILPCPVCGMVILLNLTLALSLSEYPPLATTGLLFGLFSGIILTTLGLLFFFRQKISTSADFLGSAMVLIALYFLLTILIAPIYPEIKAAFAMAVSNNPGAGIEPRPGLVLFAAAVGLISLGFVRAYFKKGDPS